MAPAAPIGEEVDEDELLVLFGPLLRAEVEGMLGIFKAFDDAIRRVRCDAQSLAEVANGLVMRGVYFELLLTEDLAQASPLLHQHIVTMAVAWLAGVIDLCFHFGRDVLDQCPARRHVHHLHAETDPQRGNASLARD